MLKLKQAMRNVEMTELKLPKIDSTDQLINERAKTHGDYMVQSQITQDLKTIIRFSPNYDKMSAAQREALDMFSHKIGRILAGDPNEKDHWDDIAGYARLVADRVGQVLPQKVSGDINRAFDNVQNKLAAALDP